MSANTDEHDSPAALTIVAALASFIVPLALGILLQWQQVLGLIQAAIIALGVVAITGHPGLYKHFPLPLMSLILGFSFNLWGEVSGFLGFFVGLFVLLFSGVHLFFWMQFLGFTSKDFRYRHTLSSHGRKVDWEPTSRSDYLPKYGTAWLARTIAGFAWAIDGRVSEQLQVGVDQWSRPIARVTAASPAPTEPPVVVGTPTPGHRCQGQIDGSGRLTFNAPRGSHVLRGEPFSAVDGQGAPGFGLWLDDQPTGLLLEQGASVLWSDDGQSLVCFARAESQSVEETTSWLWRSASGWRPLEEPWQSLVDEPLLEWGAPMRLEGGRLFYDALMHGPQAERSMSLTLCTELEGERAGTASLQPASMSGDAQPWLTLLRKSRDGRRHAFACHIGAWQLPGLWCLDHRISDCGRYLALIAFAEAPAIPHQLVVADVLARRLLRVDEPLLIARLEAFEDGVIRLQQIVGRRASAMATGPLPHLEALAPAAEQADAFVALGRLHHRITQIAVDPWSLRLLPNWRLQWRPVPASAQGDYLLAAPGAGDAAWLFGLDRYVREGNALPGGACVLTASGCGVANLAPSMAWSADGRYLALSRRVIGEVTVQWHLLLLDTQDHTLRHDPQPLAAMPCFEAFDAAGLHVSGVEQQVQLVVMETLLALPRQMLIRTGDIWLLAEQLSDAVHWHRLDSRHLQSWRSPGGESSRA